jgi:hydroxypyruvate reductase
MSVSRDRLLGIFQRALVEANPGRAVAEAVVASELQPLLQRRPRVVLAVGKAAWSMASAVGGERGLVISHVKGAQPGLDGLVAGHPIPDERSVQAAVSAQTLVAAVPADGVLVALISGGASALLARPREGLTLDEKIRAVTALSATGAAIDELNAVRQCLSAIKAGGLVRHCAAPVLTLVVSDVQGDDPEIVGSGPTVGTWTRRLGGVHGERSSAEKRCARARAAVERSGIGAALPATVARILEGHDDLVADVVAPRLDDLVVIAAGFERVQGAAVDAARVVGLDPVWPRSALGGEVAAAAARIAAAAAELAPGQILVSGGEATMRLPSSPGRGGRCQHLALLLARAFAGQRLAALVVGSDGQDGPDLPAVAGAFVDGDTWARIHAAGLDPEAAIAAADSRIALEAAGAIVVTGPTGLNHADLVLVLRR